MKTEDTKQVANAKDARLKLVLKAPSGFTAEGNYKINVEQWGQINEICHSDKAARLSKAAPDMLEALKEAEAGLEFAGAEKEIPEGDFIPAPTLSLRIVRAAIAKAEGKEVTNV